MRSLRNRLLFGSILVMVFGLIVASVVVFMTVSQSVYSEFDKALIDKARALSAFAEFTQDEDAAEDDGPVVLEFDFVDTDLIEFTRSENPAFFQLWDSNHSVLGRSRSLGKDDLPVIASRLNQPAMRSVELPDGRQGRQVTFRFLPKVDDELTSEHVEGIPENAMATIAVASGTSHVDRMLSRLGWLLATVNGLMIVISVGLIVVVVQRGLSPLRDIASVIGRVDENSLTQQIDTSNAPLELIPIVERLNGLLGRLHDAFVRERSFSSDVAHELRTPLAGILATIEVCRSRNRTESEYCEALDRCFNICLQSRQMVEALLEISRIERGNIALKMKSANIKELLIECWEPFQSVAQTKDMHIDWSTVEPTNIKSDLEKLCVVFRNLFQNAVCHGDTGTRIGIATYARNGSVHVRFENTTSGIKDEQLPRIFDRFWRGDEARSQTGDHSGLGLALVRNLVDALSARIEVTVSDGIFRCDVILPLSIPAHTF